MGSEDALLRNARQKQMEAEDKAMNREVRHAASLLQRQLQSNPVLKRVKADAERQQRLVGSGQAALVSSSSLSALQSASGVSSRGGSKAGDDVLRKARKLNAKVMAEFS